MRQFVLLFAVLILGGGSLFAQEQLTVTSEAFEHDKYIPMKYSCQGEGISPTLEISNIPEKAKCLAIIMHDPDAPMEGGFTHWIVWNMPVDRTIPENYTGAMQGVNSSGKTGFIGMCPPSGIHHYNFRVYALKKELNLSATVNKAELEKAMKRHVLAEGVLTGLYKKVGM